MAHVRIISRIFTMNLEVVQWRIHAAVRSESDVCDGEFRNSVAPAQPNISFIPWSTFGLILLAFATSLRSLHPPRSTIYHLSALAKASFRTIELFLHRLAVKSPVAGFLVC